MKEQFLSLQCVSLKCYENLDNRDDQNVQNILNAIIIGDKYRVKEACSNGIHDLKKGEILTEIGAYNFEKCYREDGGECNDIVHDTYGYICDAGSKFRQKYLENI